MKKLFALLFTLLFCTTLAQPALSASGAKIGGINHQRWDNPQQVAQDAADIRDITGGRVSGGSEIRIYLDADMFVDEDGDPFGGEGDGVSKADLRGGRVSVSASKQKNSNLVEKITLEYDSDRRTSYINIAFIDPYTGTGKRTWKATLQLKVNGKAQPETAFLVEAMLQNTEIKVPVDADSVYLSASEYANPDDYIKGITMVLDNDVEIVTNLFGNKKYYAAATPVEPALADNAQVDQSWRVTTTNLVAGSILRFTGLEGEFYVYGADGRYLGKSSEDLPVARAYHFTKTYVEELEVEGREEAAAGRGGGGSGAGDDAVAAEDTGGSDAVAGESSEGEVDQG